MPLSFSSPISSSSPVVDQVIDRKRRIHESHSKLKWALANFLAGTIIFFEAENHFVLRTSSTWRLILSRIEITCSIIFIINAVIDSLAHFFPFGISQTFGGGVGSSPQLIPVSPRQRKLLGVAENDPLFGTSTPKQDPKPSDKASHPFGFPPPLEGSFVASSTPARASTHQMDYHNMSSPSSMMSGSPSVTEVSSWLYYKPQQPPSPQQPSTPKSGQETKKLTASPDGVITNENMLREYIASLDAKDDAKKDLNNSSTFANQSSSVYWQRSFVGSGATGSGLPPASSPLSAQDYSPILKKLSYQVSSPMPNVVSPTGADESGTVVAQGSGLSVGSGGKRIAHTSTEHICHRLGIDPLDLASWMQNLRLWISQTILARLVKEIETTNKALTGHGISDVIGQVGVEKLRKYGQLVSDVSTSINGISPFLEFTVHQDYLVHRISELSRGGAISDYKWNGGSNNFKGQPWTDKLPTDCEIIMNCLAAYLDNCMPPNYSTPEGKPFSNFYFVKAPEKSDAKLPASSDATATTQTTSTSVTREKCVIMQAAQKPPYFYLQLQDDKLDVSPGRNNLFHTLILFLHYIKTKEGGILGRINFGASGINLLWVID